MAKKTKKIPGVAGVARPARPPSALVRDDPKQARRALDDALHDLEGERASKAIKRARTWVWLLKQLEQLRDDREWVAGRKRFKVWIHPRDAEELARQSKLDFKEARAELAFVEEHGLEEGLADAAHRIVLLEDGLEGLRAAIVETSRRIFQGMRASTFVAPIEEPDGYCALNDWGLVVGDEPLTTLREIADTIKAVRMLLEQDLALARKAKGFRLPADREKCVLRELLLADGGRSAEELSEQLRGRVQPDGKKRSIDAKGVSDAVDRLRKECGYRIPNDGKTGYRVDDADRELAREHGVSDGTDGTLSE